MYEMNVTIKNETGLHARPAAMFVKLAAKYASSIQLSRTDRPEKRVNAKSMVFVLSISASMGTEIRICADGPDEEAAVTALVALIESDFADEVVAI